VIGTVRTARDLDRLDCATVDHAVALDQGDPAA
jgi:hypothetical protein